MIEDYGPKSIVVGESFNKQKCGNSAMWFKLSSSALSSELLFDGVSIQMSIRDNGFASALISQELLEKPRFVQLSVYDPVTRLKSEPVEFLINSSNNQ